MKKAPAALAVIFFCANLGAAVEFDAAASGSSGAGTASIVTYSHTVGAGDNRVIVVYAGMQSTGAGNPVTQVTYNGVALTMEFEDIVSFQLAQSVWYGVAPDSGAHPVSVFHSTAQKTVSGSVSLANVHQSEPICNSNSVLVQAAAPGPVTVSVTTAQDNCMLVDFGCIGTDDETPAINSGQTSRWNNGTTGNPDAGNSTARGATRLVGAAGAYDMSYNWAVTKQYGVGGVAVREVEEPNGMGMSLMKYLQPILEPPFAEGTESLLLMENNVDDEVGAYSWTNLSSVPFSGSPVKEGSYCAGQYAAADPDKCIHSGTIAEVGKTIELWFYWPTGHDNTNCYVVGAWGSPNVIPIYATGNALQFFDGTGWSATYGISDDTWYNVATTFDTDGWHLFVTNIERASLANTPNMAGRNWHIGNGGAHAETSDGYIDTVRLSSVVRSSFPTVD